MILYIRFLYLAAFTVLLVACSSKPEKKGSTPVLAKNDPGSTFRTEFADRFQFDDIQGYDVIRVFNPFKNRSDTLSYLLYSSEEPKPEGIKGVQFIPVPLDELVIFSTTHAAMLEALNAHEVVTGIGEPEWVVSSRFRRLLDEGKIAGLPGAGDLAMEQLISLKPDAIMLVGQFFTQYTKLQKLRELGIHIIVNSDWLETSPLGRAEWIKIMGMLTGRSKTAQNYFQRIKKNYERIDALTDAASVSERPKVLMNLSFKDQWYVPGGNSYMASFLRDAAADYLWSHIKETGGIPLAFEEIYQQGRGADVWLNPGAATSLAEIKETDKRLAKFKAFKNKEVYNITKRRGATGGFAFWERGVVHPDEILADLTRILHPQLLPDHRLIYYERLE